MFDEDGGVVSTVGALAALVWSGDPPADEGAWLAEAARRVGDLDADDVLAVIGRAARVAAFAEAVSLLATSALGEVVRAEGDQAGRGGRDAGELARSAAAGELSVATATTPRTAEARLDHAEHVVACLPRTWAALAGGRLDGARVYRLSDGTAGLSVEAAGQVESRVLDRAPDQTTAQVSRSVARARMRVAPETAEVSAARVRGRSTVYTRAYPDDPGLADLVLTGPSPLIAAAFARIDTLARDRLGSAPAEGLAGATRPSPEIGAPVDAGDGSLTVGQARVDAALAVLAGDDESVARVAGVSVELVVVAPAGTVLGAADEPGELVGPVSLGPLPPAVVRELAADARWRRWFTDASGAVTGVGRRTYRPPQALVDVVRARDRTCRFPRCSRRAERCDIDHTVRFPEGETSVENLSCLCRRHHRLKHEAGWQAHREDPDSADLTWTTPLGQTVQTHPDRHEHPAQQPGRVGPDSHVSMGEPPARTA